MRLINADKLLENLEWVDEYDHIISEAVKTSIGITQLVDAIPVWYIIRWYEKRYKLGSTVADDWERGLLKEKIAEMHDDFKNEKYLDNKQEAERFAQMVKEVIELYNDWEKENETETDRCK